MEQAGESTGPSRQLRAIEGVAADASLEDLRTQGFNIKLPHEQKLNAVIEVAKEIQLFPFRKLALYENARGVVTFPGGFGTLDELFEIWNLAATGKLSDPIAAVGVDFWSPMLKALREVAVEQRSLISEADANRLFVSDDPTALLDHMLTSTPAPMGFESEPKQLTATLLKEVDVVTKGLRSLRTAVAFIGGETLKADDPTLEVARALSAHIAGKGAAVRVGDQGTAATTVLAAATTAGADKAHLQEVLWGSTADSTAGSTAGSTVTTTAKTTTTTTATLSERIPHKELFLRSAEAYVVLPAGLKGLDEFATVLCQMQNDKLPMRPLILVGSDYWQPLLDAWKTSMLSGERQLIAPEDMDLVTVVDTVEQAKAALTNLR
jgi:predicted Rossmann-fold nucleotide-binding protein